MTYKTDFPFDDILAELPTIYQEYADGDLRLLLKALNEKEVVYFETIREECAKYTRQGTAYFEALVRFIETKVYITIPELV